MIKVYIGQTSFTIQSRWDRHLRDSKRDGYSDRPLYRAINKYGVDKFYITEIERGILTTIKSNISCFFNFLCYNNDRGKKYG